MDETSTVSQDSATASGPDQVPTTYYQVRTWVDWLIGDEVTARLVLRATIVSLAPLVVGLLVADAGGVPVADLRSPSTYLVGVGILLTTLSYG